MKLFFHPHSQRGSGLIITMFMTSIALATLAGALAWSMSNTRINERSNQHLRSVAAAEAVTETVLGFVTRDFLKGGAKLVIDNSNSYQNIILTSTNPGSWAGWQFNNALGQVGRTYVSLGAFSNYITLDSAYSGLRGFVCPVTVVSNARLTNTVQNVVGAVKQELQLANVPIFQFAMFSSGDMEISCGQPFRITGKVHSNKMLYVEPGSELTFMSDVTCVVTNVFGRHPQDDRPPPVGTVIYRDPTLKREGVAALTLPIGTNNSPLAIREILQPPPSGESINSLLGRQRYYNLVDMIITVAANGTVTATTGVPLGTNSLPNPQIRKFAFTAATNYFTDARERKIVRPLNIDIAELVKWSNTNKSRFGSRDLSSIYVLDLRVTNDLVAVRVFNGTNLPSGGLTIATARPLYVEGHYNQTNRSNLGTSNTTTTLPASLVADAITILSENWLDPASTNTVRLAAPTTVNAALLTGVVETEGGDYSGGMENFPRFLETWGLANVFTYNGSMVKMFPSQYATNKWGRTDVYVYDPPARNWAYDLNFNVASKMPPLTPSLQKVFRGQWVSLPPNQITNAPSSL